MAIINNSECRKTHWKDKWSITNSIEIVQKTSGTSSTIEERFRWFSVQNNSMKRKRALPQAKWTVKRNAQIVELSSRSCMNCDRREKKRKRARENRGERPSPLRDFSTLSRTIFKLSASAYDAHVKSCRVDFRLACTSREEGLLKCVANARCRRGPRGWNESSPPSPCRTYIRLTLDLPFGMLTISYVRGRKRIKVENWRNIS